MIGPLKPQDGIAPHASHIAILVAFFATLAWSSPAIDIDIRNLGAKGDDKTLNTLAIQSAISEVHKQGGGTVLVPEGVYITGTIKLLSGVKLHLKSGAVIKGSPDPEQYTSAPDLEKVRQEASQGPLSSLIIAENQKRIAITGPGLIDGNGLAFERGKGRRPRVLCFYRCEGVRIEGVTTLGGRSWTQHYIQCRDVSIRDVTVNAQLTDLNNDGIDIEECHNVKVTGTTVIADDDAIVLKSRLTHDHGTRDILIENCKIYGKKSAVKMGTETIGLFENITIRNISAFGTRGINLFSVDGAFVKNVLVENVAVQNGYAAILVRLGNCSRFTPASLDKPLGPGKMGNIVLRNVSATLASKSFRQTLIENGIALIGQPDDRPMPIAEQFISGLPGFAIEDVRLENIVLRQLPGGGVADDVIREIPEKANGYPAHGMFGKLPAYGFYIRHARNVSMNNCVFDLTAPDARPTIFTDDAPGFNARNITSSQPVRILDREDAAAKSPP